jgi:hypothetical protein
MNNQGNRGNQKICFKGDEVQALFSGKPLSAPIAAKLALVRGSNLAVRLRGMRFHYDMMNIGCLYFQMLKPDDDTPIPDLATGTIDYEELD